MPRKLPTPEDRPYRTTISIPTKIFRMAEAYRHRERDELLKDFSALVARALLAYAKIKHPELLDQTVMHIRDEEDAKSRPYGTKTPERFPGNKPTEAPRRKQA